MESLQLVIPWGIVVLLASRYDLILALRTTHITDTGILQAPPASRMPACRAALLMQLQYRTPRSLMWNDGLATN